MLMLELTKLRRRKILYMIPFVAILLFLLEFMIGHQIYQGHSYGSVNGWYLLFELLFSPPFCENDFSGFDKNRTSV